MAMNFSSNGRKVEEPPQIIKANIYDNPQFALDLVAHICTEKEDIEIDSFFDVYKQKRENLIKEVSQLYDNLTQCNFRDHYFIPLCKRLKYLYWDVSDAVLNTSSSKLKIAVAGGYSAGKSSLLNALTEIGDKLPTGIEPVSIVNTQLNCKKRNSFDEKIVIRGINLADKYVKLDEEVLSGIKHSAKNNVPLTSVLKSIILDIPSPDFLDGITFVDTPGYNNSPNKNKENNATDSDTAKKGIETSDIVFWCIDIDAGTITGKDLEILSKIDGKDKPTFIFFTKMDKKPETERNKIITLASSQVKEKLKNCLGVVGISSINGTIKFYSPNGDYSKVEAIVKSVVRQYAKTSVREGFVNYLKNQFDEIIQYIDKSLDECENNRRELIENKNKLPEIIRISKKEKDETINSLRRKDIPAFAAILEAYNTDSYLLENIKALYDEKINYLEKKQDCYDTDYKTIINEKNVYSEIRILLCNYKMQLSNALEYAYQKAKEKVQNHFQELKSPKEKNSDAVQNNVFDAIGKDDYKAFIQCFAGDGVDMRKARFNGYSPLTFAVSQGNNLMVKFFIEHGAKLDAKDNNGCNAFETAEKFHYQDICEMLKAADDTLPSKSGDLMALYNQNSFINFLK